MKQVFITGRGVAVEEVPSPKAGKGRMLVRVHYSCISAGTEMASVKVSGMSLYQRALRQPHNVKKVIDLARTQGVKRTVDTIKGRLSAGIPSGYSVSGVVMEVGEGVQGFSAGDEVACAGAGIANHAEIVNVPVNLAVKLPEGAPMREASTVALGSIALQGIRRAAPTLGETVAVMGLGVLGQITVQLLKANGCRTIGGDLERARIGVAREHGLDEAVYPGDDFVERCHALTNGAGADAVIVAAATDSDEVISQAMRACRRKGRVVVVGDVGLNLKRSDLYAKELDFFISTSYGPGRYDASYELDGQDYPLAYVRWTENRNMEEYLRLLGSGKISLEGMLDAYDIDDAPRAYEELKKDGKKPLIALLSYPHREEASATKVVMPGRARPAPSGKIRVAVAGAGGFAMGMHLPNIARLGKSFSLRCVMSRTGSNAKTAASRYDAEYATTDFDAVLSDPDVDLVMILTRHDLHAEMTLAALRAGKNVFVEKPLALTEGELAAIEEFYRDNAETAPLLMTGFNRRFSPAIRMAKDALNRSTTPLLINYRMNAGYLPPDHWTQTGEGGGRNMGEACHIYDLFNYLTGETAEKVEAASVRPSSPAWRKNDNFTATITYDGGSLCSLTYTSQGSPEYPKEKMEIFADGKVISLDDYKTLSVNGKARKWSGAAPDKGHMSQLESLAECLGTGGQWPVSLAEQLSATRVGFQVENLIR